MKPDLRRFAFLLKIVKVHEDLSNYTLSLPLRFSVMFAKSGERIVFNDDIVHKAMQQVFVDIARFLSTFLSIKSTWVVILPSCYGFQEAL